jgi:hypothetical protein|tara:strand:+ start:2277 stop:3125 length:849 start_codon:yes stop_codon:yes gene_type:complete
MAIDDDGASTEPVEQATTLTEGQFNFKEHLAPEYKDHTALADINDVNGMAKSYISAQEMIGQQRLPMPVAEADPSEWSRFYDSVGRPQGQDGDGYKFDIPEGTTQTEDAVEMEKFFRKSMHDAGLSQKQAQAMYKSYEEFSGQFSEKQANTTADMEKQWDTDIRQEFGLAYTDQLESAKAAVEEFGSDNLKQYLDESRLGNHPEMIKFAAKIGAELIEKGSQGRAGRQGTSVLTPDQAKSEIAQLHSNTQFMEAYHGSGPSHEEAIQRMTALHDFAYPPTEE